MLRRERNTVSVATEPGIPGEFREFEIDREQPGIST